MVKKGKSAAGPDDDKCRPQGNLFEWAESAARLIGATAQDICRAGRGVASVAITVLVPSWLTVATAADGYQGLRRALAVATLITFIFFVSAWLVRGLRSRISRPGVTIILQASAFAGVVLAFSIVVHVGLRLESELSAAAERQEQARLSRVAEQEAARLAEDRCRSERADGLEKAKRTQRNARAELDTCKVEFSKAFQPFKTAEEVCRVQIGKLDTASARVETVTKQVCNTGSVRKGQ